MMLRVRRVAFVLCVVGVLFQYSSCLQCRDENNKPVDWFAIYKFPRLANVSDARIRDGAAYLYVSSETLADGWKFSKNWIVDNYTAPAFTLAPYYKNISSQTWLLYNDEPPGEDPWTDRGHTKGVVGGDAEGGFWLVHSVPHYPSSRPGYAYPKTGLKYGQSFLCLSLPKGQMDRLGPNVVEYNAPLFYDVQVNKTDYPNIAKSVKITVSDSPYNISSTLLSLESTQFTVFAKASHYGKDLYEWVANDLRTDLVVESWQNEKDPLPSDCDGRFQVLNIGSISYSGISYPSSFDHSKWTISKAGQSSKWICIGDINRAGPQKKRGGGTVCLQNKDLWQNFNSIVHSVEDCSQTI